MTVISSSGETNKQRNNRREAAIRSKWATTAEIATSSSDFSVRWLASSTSTAGVSSVPLSSSWASTATAASLHKPLRSVHYAVRLGVLAGTSSQWASHVRKQREDYVNKRREALRDPDGTLPPGIEEGAGLENRRKRADWAEANPLNPDQQNPWAKHQLLLELLQTIETDVSRCLPEVSSLRESSVQRSLGYLLFVWAYLNPNIGYRQGMHELAGVLWIVREADSLASKSWEGPEAAQAVIDVVLNGDHIEHDTYAMFDGLMRQAVDFYQWRASDIKLTQSDPAPDFQAPILLRCANVSANLRRCDPLLAAHLNSLGIEPQLYLLRWLRLLFLREFPLSASLELWDTILGAHPGHGEGEDKLEQADWICIALLLRLRNRLLVEDQSLAFQALLHPVEMRAEGEKVGHLTDPTSVSTDPNPATETGRNVSHTALLYSQSVALRANPTPQTGVQCVFQNAESLGIPIAPPPPPEKESGEASSLGRRTNLTPSISSGPRKARVGLPLSQDLIAGGLSDLARNFYSTYTPARPDSALFATAQRLATTYGAARRSGQSRGDDGGFPERERLEELERRRRNGDRSDGLVQVQQPKDGVDGTGTDADADTDTDTDAHRELTRLKTRDLKIVQALDGIILSLEKDCTRDDMSASESGGSRWSGTAQRATHSFSTLASLKHVRDVLAGRERDFDEEVVQSISPSLQSETPAETARQVATTSAPNTNASSEVTTATNNLTLGRHSDDSVAGQPASQRAMNPTVQVPPSRIQHVSTSLPRTTMPRPRRPRPAEPSSPPAGTTARVSSASGPVKLPEAVPRRQTPVEGTAKGTTSSGDPLGVL